MNNWFANTCYNLLAWWNSWELKSPFVRLNVAPIPPLLPELALEITKEESSKPAIEIAYDNSLYDILLKARKERSSLIEDFLSSEALDKAIYNTIVYVINDSELEPLVCARDIGIPENMLHAFYEVFQRICARFDIKIERSGKYFYVNKNKLEKVLDDISQLKNSRTYDEAASRLLSTGIYR